MHHRPKRGWLEHKLHRMVHMKARGQDNLEYLTLHGSVCCAVDNLEYRDIVQVSLLCLSHGAMS
jgi:hypothetical protein